MRCMTHIVNLVVQDGLKGKDEHEAISRIRGVIRYIRNSPARYKKFQECVEFEKLETKNCSLDVPTRWNSTYLMLETAISLKIAFDAYEDVDLAYKTDLSRPPFDGMPTDYDWERTKVLFFEFTFDKLYGGTERIDVMKEQVRDGLYELFNDYKLRYGHTLQGTRGSLGSSFGRVSSSSSSSVGTSMQHIDYEATRTFTIEQEFSM
ncbi:UNVERIFIED_CONTAM: hypothetical protein Sradi_2081600 [Sesamum radiatum]|uniref:Uncharacterized protein n=1 Tax=Sesamum radiatum TaxID=300843 RepID=A0AAW2TIQ4_SESRA